MTVVETPSFIRDAKACMTEEEQADLVSFLAENPTSGVILKGSGEVRKVRWRRSNEGKSGGVRVIYFFQNDKTPLFALNVFAKNEEVNLTHAELNALRSITEGIVRNYAQGVAIHARN